MWIFKSFSQDFFKIYLSGILAFIYLLIARGQGEDSLPMLIFGVLLFNFSDVGHVYTTIIKTWLDPNEKYVSRQYWLTPLTILVVILVWRYAFNFNYFWACVVYFDLWHNLKQGYGVVKWYESLNKRYYQLTKLFYYGLTLLPFLVFNFRTTSFSFFNYYTSEKKLLVIATEPYHMNIASSFITFDNIYHYYSVLAYFIFLNIWFIWELNHYLTNKKLDLNRLLAMFYYGGIYCYVFIFSNHVLEVLTLLIASHGYPYINMLYKRMDLIQTIKKHYGKIIIGLLILGGSLDALIVILLMTMNRY